MRLLWAVDDGLDYALAVLALSGLGCLESLHGFGELEAMARKQMSVEQRIVCGDGCAPMGDQRLEVDFASGGECNGGLIVTGL